MSRVEVAKKIWYAPEVHHYFMLDVTEHIDVQQPRAIDGVELLPKDEYHVSLVPVGKLTESPATIQAVVDDIVQLLRDKPGMLSWGGLGSERYVCREGDEMTLIAPVYLRGIEALHEIIVRHLPMYEPAFLHVTLLKSANSPRGIGINSPEDLALYCRRM